MGNAEVKSRSVKISLSKIKVVYGPNSSFRDAILELFFSCGRKMLDLIRKRNFLGYGLKSSDSSASGIAGSRCLGIWLGICLCFLWVGSSMWLTEGCLQLQADFPLEERGYCSLNSCSKVPEPTLKNQTFGRGGMTSEKTGHLAGSVRGAYDS